jgi:hypothetical protein
LKVHKLLLVLFVALGVVACKSRITCTYEGSNELNGFIANPALHLLARQNYAKISPLGWSNIEYERSEIPMSYVLSELNSGGSSEKGFASVSVNGATLAGTPGTVLLQAVESTTGKVVSQQTFAYQVSGSRLVLVAPQAVDQWAKVNGLRSTYLTIGIPDLAINTANARHGQSVSVTISLVYKNVTQASDTITFNVDHKNCISCLK